MRHIVLLRGINLGPSRRVPMADLRTLLTTAGYGDVRTYVQSGNVVLSAPETPAELEAEAARLISDQFGFDVPVIARSRDELAAVVALNPLREVATNPKRYQVSFLSEQLPDDVVETLQSAAVGDERLVAHGRELYAWHPDGVARSKMWNALAGKGLGAVATARNWTTVTTLLAMADE
jgi:uncharacterized protein (DUF1697 family)